MPEPPNSISLPANPRSVSPDQPRYDRREPEDVAVEVGEIRLPRPSSPKEVGMLIVPASVVICDACARSRQGAAVEAQGENLVVDFVGKEILSLQAFALPAIEPATDDCMADRVVVGKIRGGKRAGADAAAGEHRRPLEDVPSVLAPRSFRCSDLFPLALADIGDEEIAGPAVETCRGTGCAAEGKKSRPAPAVPTNILSLGSHNCESGARECISPMHVEPEHLAEQAVDVLPLPLESPPPPPSPSAA